MSRRSPLLWIMLGLAAWGAFHAFGAYYQYRPQGVPYNPWRGLVVLACSAGFLGFWALLLASRARRRPSTPPPTTSPPAAPPRA